LATRRQGALFRGNDGLMAVRLGASSAPPRSKSGARRGALRQRPPRETLRSSPTPSPTTVSASSSPRAAAARSRRSRWC
jgi:hypothetical protein